MVTVLTADAMEWTNGMRWQETAEAFVCAFDQSLVVTSVFGTMFMHNLKTTLKELIEA